MLDFISAQNNEMKSLLEDVMFNYIYDNSTNMNKTIGNINSFLKSYVDYKDLEYLNLIKELCLVKLTIFEDQPLDCRSTFQMLNKIQENKYKILIEELAQTFDKSQISKLDLLSSKLEILSLKQLQELDVVEFIKNEKCLCYYDR